MKMRCEKVIARVKTRLKCNYYRPTYEERDSSIVRVIVNTPVAE